MARGHRLAWRRRHRSASLINPFSGLARVLGASAIALALCASAPAGALAQSASPAPDAATTAAPAVAASGAASPGASIRKTPGDAASGGAPAAADNTAAASAPASPSSVAPAAGSSGGAASSAAPAAEESAGAPAALSTPTAHAKVRGGHRTHSKSATQTASAKTDSKDASAGSKGDQDSQGQDAPFSSLQFSGNKGPIDIRSDALDLDYKGNVVTFRGHVHAAQADALLTSDTLTVTYGKDFHEVKEMVANANVRMSQGTRWATGDHAVLDQAKHIVILTGSPVVHDGEDQVTGSKITVHLDTGKSEVEGARAVFFPAEQKTRDNKTTVAKSP